MLIHDDCLNALKGIEDESIDMIYVDPPFFTQKVQKLKNREGQEFSFHDVWETRDEYILYLKERFLLSKSKLKQTGLFFLHCDTNASHYLKILLDDIFGEGQFINEIIWTYKRWSNSSNKLLPAHQTIFMYSKGEKYNFNKIFCDYSPTTNVDQILQSRERNDIGKVIYKKDDDGNIVYGKRKTGVPLSDVWEIPFLNPKAKERTGYPTQKPLELIEKIISISTKEGDLILDPFCGSGTTLVAAKRLKRNFIGIDVSEDAIAISEDRLKKLTKTESVLLKKGKESYLNKTPEELHVLKKLNATVVQRNSGIDGFLKDSISTKPTPVKIQKAQESFDKALYTLIGAGKKKGAEKFILVSKEYLTPEEESQLPKNVIVLYDIACQLKNKFI